MRLIDEDGRRGRGLKVEEGEEVEEEREERIRETRPKFGRGRRGG